MKSKALTRIQSYLLQKNTVVSNNLEEKIEEKID